MRGTLAIVGLNSVNAQNMSPPESNMTGANAGNMTPSLTPFFCYGFQLLQVGRPRQEEDLPKF